MKHFVTILAIFTAHFCYSQELDIFQNDSIYAKHKIRLRTMYQTNGENLQKEMITKYNSKGQIIKQYWFWNGESKFHNVESFYYSKLNLLSSIIDSFADGNIEKTTLIYHRDNLKRKFTINQNNDTIYFTYYPSRKIEIQRWYREGKAYRFDTTIYERGKIKYQYNGTDCANPERCSKWSYKFLNKFDKNGNLIKVWCSTKKSHISFIKYNYDSRNLLIKKRETFYENMKAVISTEYSFVYE